MSDIPWELSFLQKIGANGSIPWFLMASYLYYIKHESLLHVHQFDILCRYMLDNWTEIEHMHKHLIDVEDLKAGTGFSLKEEDYPQIVKNCAWEVFNERR